jgi:hypothetical protein
MKTLQDTQGEQVVDQQNEDVIDSRSKNLNKMMKYPQLLLPLMKLCKKLFLLCSKMKRMRLVLFLFKILMIPYFDLVNEEGVKVLDEVEVPCCVFEDKEAVHEDEAMTHAENTRVLEIPAQEETVSYPPLINFDDALPCNEKEEEDESSNPACYDTDTDIADLDEFIHVGRRRWDVIGYDLDPIYDTESHLQLLPLQLSQQITYDQWQQGDEVFTCSFQNTKDDLVPCFSDDFQSYLEMFDEYAEHLNPFYKDDCHHRCVQTLIQVRTLFA